MNTPSNSKKFLIIDPGNIESKIIFIKVSAFLSASDIKKIFPSRARHHYKPIDPQQISPCGTFLHSNS